MKRKNTVAPAFRAAFPFTIPMFAGFWFIGLTYGVYMDALGFSFWYPMLMSLIIYGGSLEFVAAAMLLAPFDPLKTLAVALMIQARHLFYGIAMLERFKGTGWKKWYLIFGMCDESFSINYTAQIPQEVDRGWFMFFVTWLNRMYWVSGATLGGLLGGLIAFDTEGLEFVMPAMFAVIFLDQWKKEGRGSTALLGVGAALGCRLLFGAEAFMVPAMACILASLTLARGRLERREEPV